ncbi:MAG: ketol-acid reductoisomerase [Vampirovibrionales bacterium]
MSKPQPCWHDADIDLAPLQQRTVGLVGYGNHGHPQALNLRDSGINVVVGARANSTKANHAKADGFTVVPMAELPNHANVLMLLVPDHAIGDTITAMEPRLTERHFIAVGHGYAWYYHLAPLPPHVNGFLAAPKSHGSGVRQKFVDGSGVPALVAVHQDPSGETLAVALAYLKAIGSGRVGIYPTTIQEETVCDLFSEQAVLCGGLSRLVTMAFEALVERGYSEDVAYIRCFHELKLIAQLLCERGPTGLRDIISPAARVGDLLNGDRILDAHTRHQMETILTEIENGTFAQQLAHEVATNFELSNAHKDRWRHHGLERVHRTFNQ